MASKFCTLLLFVPVIYASIEVKIKASDKESKRSVLFSGNNIDIISDAERDTFQLSDETLKDSVGKFFGKRPDDAYLRSPTPWGDLYSTYKWTQVSRTLSPQKGRILEVSSKPTIVYTQRLKNEFTNTSKFTVKISQKVENTVSSAWFKEGSLTVDQDLEFIFDFDIISGTADTSISFASKWGENGTKSETVTVGSETGVEVLLGPNQNVTVDLYATKGLMKIQVDYEASLSGVTAVNYAEPYKGHHFWALDINDVMSSGGLNLTTQSSEVITLGYFADSVFKIRDFNSKELLFSKQMEVY